jgi:7-carboxy-7-deazaguanine synthase
MTVPEIAAQVLGFGARHVVVTGGEPMIAPEIIPLTENLKGASLHITIETAGTVYTPVRCDLMSVSPKLSNSTPLLRDGGRWAAQHERLRHQSDVLRQLAFNYRHQFKFVIAQPSDLSEVQAIVSELALSPECVILMPEGVNRDVLQSRGLWLADICKKFGYRFSPRLHVDLWGDKRGV